MKLSIKTLAVGLLALTAATGCEDFLDSAPQGQLDALTLANAAGVEATLVGAYAALGYSNNGGWGTAPSNWPFGSVPSDDAYKGSEASDQPDINSLEQYTWSTGGAEAYLDDKWSHVYDGVTRANSTIRLVNSVKEIPGELTDAQAASIEGEALFLRAHFHFEAWKFWKNIPYYTEEDTDFRKANTPSAQVIQNILADLDRAIGLLPATPRNGEVGRVTSWTARAYKGRVQVYSGDYGGGLTTLREVRTSGPYALEDNFHQVWTAFSEFQNGPETILAYQASISDGEPSGNNANYGERLNFPHSGSPFGCCGFHQPTQNLVNFFKVDAVSGLPLALSVGDLEPLDATADWNASDTEFVANDLTPVDPRLDWTMGRDGVPYKDYSAHNDTWIRNVEYGGPYSPKKHVHEQAANAQSPVGWNSQHLNSTNYHLYRYADLLLLLAEAEVEAGVLENAREIVNEIRTRAGQVAQGPVDNMVVPIDDPSITWANYVIGTYDSPWTDQAVARSAVRYERRLELAMEGHRLFDLQRWNEAPDVLNAYIGVEQTRMPHLLAAAAVAQRHNDYYPIPSVQIELSQVEGEETLTQNPGWGG